MTRPQPSGPLVLFLLGAVALLPPVGLVLWIALAGASRPEYLRSPIVRTGLVLVGVGALPVVGVLGLPAVGVSAGAGLASALWLLVFLGIVGGSVVLGVGIAQVRLKQVPRRRDSPPPKARLPRARRTAPWSELQAYLHPLLRVGAGLGGCLLLALGVTMLVRRLHGGGAGAALLLGAATLGFGLTGRSPWWWRE